MAGSELVTDRLRLRLFGSRETMDAGTLPTLAGCLDECTGRLRRVAIAAFLIEVSVLPYL
jgi:hypothetical protein